ncbi:MAG: hypothetical protein RL226_643, partial [Bacteroidota bacterium]
RQVDFALHTSRKQVEEVLRSSLKEESVVMFLLKNLYWEQPGKLNWRFNAPVLERTIGDITGDTGQQICLTDTLFVRGLNSNYITDEDQVFLNHYFPHSVLRSIDGAGHWLHAEAPDEFFNLVDTFLKHA